MTNQDAALAARKSIAKYSHASNLRILSITDLEELAKTFRTIAEEAPVIEQEAPEYVPWPNGGRSDVT